LNAPCDGKAEALFYDSMVNGATLADGLQKALLETIAKLPIPKVMSYQLQSDCELPGWTSVSFVRPAHGLVALHGSEVVPVQALGLRIRQPHRRATASRPTAVTRRRWPMPTAYADTPGAETAPVIARLCRTPRRDRSAAAWRQQPSRRWPASPSTTMPCSDEVTALVERRTC